jgi:hypothetical protein
MISILSTYYRTPLGIRLKLLSFIARVTRIFRVSTHHTCGAVVHLTRPNQPLQSSIERHTPLMTARHPQ